jgi:hypothetical protein
VGKINQLTAIVVATGSLDHGDLSDGQTRESKYVAGLMEDLRHAVVVSFERDRVRASSDRSPFRQSVAGAAS